MILLSQFLVQEFIHHSFRAFLPHNKHFQGINKLTDPQAPKPPTRSPMDSSFYQVTNIQNHQKKRLSTYPLPFVCGTFPKILQFLCQLRRHREVQRIGCPSSKHRTRGNHQDHRVGSVPALILGKISTHRFHLWRGGKILLSAGKMVEKPCIVGVHPISGHFHVHQKA